MDLDLISVIGEWVATIAVVVSLLYLARQIHIANQQSEAAARYSFLDAYGQANSIVAASKESALVFYDGLEDNEMDVAEQTQFMVMIGQFLNTWTVMYDLHQKKQLPESQWIVVKTDLLVCFSSKGGYHFWNEIGRHNVSDEFEQWIDNLLDSDENPYPFVAHAGRDKPPPDITNNLSK